MYKRIFAILIFAFLIIGAASAAEFKANDNFETVNEYYAQNEADNMYLYTWDYDDELLQECYLHNDTDYLIKAGDNNTYNVTYNSHNEVGAAISYAATGNFGLDYGVLEIAEVDGKKYIFMAYKEAGNGTEEWKTCYDELMKFNENNNIEPLADAI